MFVKIIDDDGEPKQLLEPAQNYHQEVLKMSEFEWHKTLTKLLNEPLELVGGRLFRFDLVETEKEKYFLRTAHHIAFDGKEIFAETYNSLDFANDENLTRSRESFNDAKNYYEKIFGGLDVESLPIPDLEATATAFENFSYIFDADYSDLREFCKKNNINASALTCGAFGYMFGIYTAQNEMFFRMIYHGRQDERVKNIGGMYVETLPVYMS